MHEMNIRPTNTRTDALIIGHRDCHVSLWMIQLGNYDSSEKAVYIYVQCSVPILLCWDTVVILKIMISPCVFVIVSVCLFKQRKKEQRIYSPTNIRKNITSPGLHL